LAADDWLEEALEVLFGEQVIRVRQGDDSSLRLNQATPQGPLLAIPGRCSRTVPCGPARAQPALDSNRGLEAAIDVSVVVPFYNAERSVEDCIAALRAQTLAPPRYEIIMVDNNSTDGSADLVRKYPDVRLLSEEKQGSYAARNRGVAAARGAIVAFTDADCRPAST
jgi:hypothetical protein